MISLASISLCNTRHPNGSVPPPPGQVSVQAFSRDRTLFDSGVGFGRAVADVPLAGGATAGEVIQARALSLDDAGATSTAWSDIATADGQGQWSGTLPVPRGVSWYRAEVRLKALPGITASGANRFGVGHVIAIWGESEPDRIVSTLHDATTPPVLADDEAVQIFVGAAANPARHFVTNAQPYTAAVAAMADTLISARPGEKFAVVFQTVPGTDPRTLVNDADPGRAWTNDRALHDLATADGQDVGLAAMSWFGAPGSLGADYGPALFPLFSGRLLNGTPVTFPATITYGAGASYHADHWFGELYDSARTKWAPYGPHRFDIDGDMQDATHYVGGAPRAVLVNTQAARGSWRAMLASPEATMFVPASIEPVTYVNGHDDGAGGWTDIANPAGNTPDGTQAFARQTALAILRSSGLLSHALPVFDQCLWEAAGAYVEVWSSAGAITTTRLKRGEPALGTTQPHWTTVMGFQINGVPATNAQIVGGRVRIFPNSGSFTSVDTIQYGEGGASGALQFPEDNIAATWKNLPILDVTLPGLSGLPMRPLPAAAVLANTLPVAPAHFTTSASGPYFLDPANVPSGTTAITFAGKFRMPAMPGTSFILFSQASTGFDVEVLTSGNLRVTIEDGTGAKMLSSYIVGTGLLPGIWYDIVCSADQAAKVLRVRINGTLVATVNFSGTGNGLFQSNRALSFLARNSGVPQFVGDVEYLKVWLTAVATGDAPTTTPRKAISGTAAVVNADAWKQGANAT